MGSVQILSVGFAASGLRLWPSHDRKLGRIKLSFQAGRGSGLTNNSVQPFSAVDW